MSTKFYESANLTLKLNTGAEMPVIGLGCAGGMKPEEQAKARDWILNALKTGYRHLDTASLYDTEESVGHAIRASGIPREELFVTTKLPWNGFERGVKKVFTESFEKLDIGYIDLYEMHWPTQIKYVEGNEWFFISNPDENPLADGVTFNDAYAEMEGLLATGKVKAIGVSNFSIKNLEKLFETAKVVPAVNQIETHPYLVEEELIQYCKSKGIAVTAYTPTGRDVVRADPVLNELAAKYNVTATQIIIGWHVARGISLLPSSTNAKRQKENITAPILSEEDVKRITALNRNDRISVKPFLSPNGTLTGWTAEQFGWTPFL